MNFRQLFDVDTGTYTYLFWEGSEGAIIDPVLERAERDLRLVDELNVSLKYIFETHVHADHITGAAKLKEKTGANIAVCEAAGCEGPDVSLKDGDELKVGGLTIKVLQTPGHTDGCVSYFVGDRVFTGDALLIRKCGRTDFQQGDSKVLFQSVRSKLFALPDETLVFPGHDYEGRTVSSIAEEKAHNARLNQSIGVEEFVKIMDGLKLAPPKRLDEAVPANLKCGRV